MQAQIQQWKHDFFLNLGLPKEDRFSLHLSINIIKNDLIDVL